MTDLTPPNATTGDEFNISFMVVDNVLVDQVVLVMDDGFTNVTTSYKDFNNNGLCTFKYTAPTRIVDEVKYSVTATDPSGNGVGLNGSFRVVDNDPPELFADNTNYPITTGDLINFSFDIRDNMGVAWANLTILCSNDTIREIELMKGPGTNWFNSTKFGSSEGYDVLNELLFNGPPLALTLSFGDAFGNSRTLRLPDRKLVDNDPPVFLEDLSDIEAFTGENFTFRFEAVDNIGLERAEVQYTFTDGSGYSAPFTKLLMGNVWESTVMVPLSPPFTAVITNATNLSCTMDYEFHIWDGSGNENVHLGPRVNIRDTVEPYMVEILTKETPTTGDLYELRAKFADNIRVERVGIEVVFFGGNSAIGKSLGVMTRSPSDIDVFDHSFIVPSNAYSLSCTFYINDHENMVEFKREGIAIADNDPPEILSSFPTRESTTGGRLDIWVRAEDNWGGVTARMEVWSDKEVVQYVLERKEDDNPGKNFTLRFDIPTDSVAPVHMVIRVTDVSNNTYSAPEVIVKVKDNIAPVIVPMDDLTVKKGENVDIVVQGTDNIGIEQVIWEGSPITASGLRLQGVINVVGTFPIKVTILDKAGNSNSTTFSISVKDVEKGKQKNYLPFIFLAILVIFLFFGIMGFIIGRKRPKEETAGPEYSEKKPALEEGDGQKALKQAEPPSLDEPPSSAQLPPGPEKEVLIVTVPAPVPVQPYVPPDQIPAAPMPVQGEAGSYIPPPGKGKEPQLLVPRSAEEKMILEPGQEPPKMLGKEPMDELGPKTQRLLKP